MIAQLFSGLAAAWLLTSVWLWSHGPVQVANAVIVGLAVLALLPASYFLPRLRFVIAAAGMWLAFSSLTIFFWTDSVLTAGAHIVTGAIIFVGVIGPFSGVTVVRIQTETAPERLASPTTPAPAYAVGKAA